MTEKHPTRDTPADTTDQGPASQICTFDAEQVNIRGKNLVDEIMGHYSFTRLLLLQSMGQEPTEHQCRIVETVMVTIMEHGLVPSAVATRLTHYGAPESFQGAVVAGLLGVGDRYAGTAGECGEILERIVAEPPAQRYDKAVSEVNAYRELRRPVPGFGHPIHRDNDRRVDRLIELCRETGTSGDFLDAMDTLEKALGDVLKRKLVTNISAAMAAAMGEAGIPAGMMRGIVLTARCAGLVGHLYEEQQQPIGHQLWTGAQQAVENPPDD